MINTRRSQLYLAYSSPPEEVFEDGDEDEAGGSSELQPEDAAEYIAALLSSLREVAAKAHLRLLTDLLSVAEEEAKLHSRA
jgi:hypothetical protein